MGHVEVAHLSHATPDGRVLLGDASFRVGEGAVAAQVGPNGAGKATLVRLPPPPRASRAGFVTCSSRSRRPGCARPRPGWTRRNW